MSLGRFLKQILILFGFFLRENSSPQVHTVLYNSVPGFRGRSQHGAFGDNVEEMDWSVGQVLSAMDRLGIASNSLVLFTSDNGGHVEETDHLGNVAGGFNGPWRGGKGHGGWDGGYRVPTVLRWPGVVPEGSSSDEPTSNMDFFPTFAEIIGRQPNPGVALDGESLTPLLREPGRQLARERFLFQYCGDRLSAVRWRTAAGAVWKLRVRSPRWLAGRERCDYVCSCDPQEQKGAAPLYDLRQDPEERRPVSDSAPRAAEARAALLAAAERHEREMTATAGVPQLTWHRAMWRLWLQPCCNFPLCRCRDSRWDGHEGSRDAL